MRRPRILSAILALAALCAVLAGVPAPAARAQGQDAATYTAPFSGAVPRPLHSKLADTPSVRDFGAVGDGAADDTAALQKAVNAVAAAGGGSLLVPPGTYRLTAEIVFPAPGGDKNAVVELVGTPRRSVLQADVRAPFKGEAMLRIAGTPGRRQPGHRLSGLYFTTSDQPWKATGPHPAGVWSEYTGGLTIVDCQFALMQNVAVLLRAAWDAYLDRVYVWGCGAPAGHGGPEGALRVDSAGAPAGQGTNTVFLNQVTVEQYVHRGLVVDTASGVQGQNLKLHAAGQGNPFRDQCAEGLLVRNAYMSFFSGVQLAGAGVATGIAPESGFVRVEGDCVGLVFSDVMGFAFPGDHTFSIRLSTPRSTVALNSAVFCAPGPASGHILLDPASQGRVALGTAVTGVDQTPLAQDMRRFVQTRPPAP